MWEVGDNVISVELMSISLDDFYEGFEQVFMGVGLQFEIEKIDDLAKSWSDFYALEYKWIILFEYGVIFLEAAYKYKMDACVSERVSECVK